MPSIFTLDGPRLGDVYMHNSPRGISAIAVPSYGRARGPRALGVTAVEYGRKEKPPPKLNGVAGAALAGLGELSDQLKTGLIAAAVLGVIGVVAWSGSHRNRYRSLRGIVKGIDAEHVRLDRGGYDNNGRYWGRGEKLYYVADDTRSRYIRARNAKTARELFLATGGGLYGSRRRRRRRR